jgi:anhydro-N-acetylmuramic acid kinase
VTLSLDDALATVAWITAQAIKTAIAKYRVDEILASGGGTENLAIMRHLQGYNCNAVADSCAKEALAFALLAAATLDELPSNVPSVTGARRAVVLGSITPAP